MTVFRAIPLSVHGAIETALGPALIVAPFALGFGSAAMVFSVVLGGLVLAFALATHAGDEGSLPLSTHIAVDYGLSLGLVVAGLLFGISGESAALAVFAVTGLAMLALSASTRYSAGRA